MNGSSQPIAPIAVSHARIVATRPGSRVAGTVASGGGESAGTCGTTAASSRARVARSASSAAVGTAAAAAGPPIPPPSDGAPPTGRIVGKRMTSRIAAAPAMSMTIRSMPIPRPPVGGSPCSSARM